MFGLCLTPPARAMLASRKRRVLDEDEVRQPRVHPSGKQPRRNAAFVASDDSDSDEFPDDASEEDAAAQSDGVAEADEGDGGADESGEEEDDYDSADEYDADCYKGPEDRQALMDMSQIDREMLIAERMEKRERRMEALEVRARIKAQRSQKKKGATRQASARRGAAATAKEKASRRELFFLTTHFSHMSEPILPISHLQILFFNPSPLTHHPSP